MISLFNYSDYRAYIEARFKEMPKAGYGQSLRLSQHLNVHTTLVSQVLKGLKSFTPEQASSVAEFLGLTDDEAEYFVLLVQLDRAGTPALKRILLKRLDEIKKKSAELVNRLQSDTVLTEERKAVFYSDWMYSAIRQLSAIPGMNNRDVISDYLDVPKKRVNEVAEFLVRSGLCIENDGRLGIGPRQTHLENSSPWVRTHHVNWRQKAIETLSNEEDSKLHYTAPMTLSKPDALKIREMLVKFLQSVDRVIDPSPSEELHCLNIDWFRV